MLPDTVIATLSNNIKLGGS